MRTLCFQTQMFFQHRTATGNPTTYLQTYRLYDSLVYTHLT